MVATVVPKEAGLLIEGNGIPGQGTASAKALRLLRSTSLERWTDRYMVLQVRSGGGGGGCVIWVLVEEHFISKGGEAVGTP